MYLYIYREREIQGPLSVSVWCVLIRVDNAQTTSNHIEHT